MSSNLILGDCRVVLPTLAASSVQTCVTSPPYWGLRDYGRAEQIGLEPAPDEYVAQMVVVFREVRRVLRDDGTLWLNLGDSYARSVEKGGSGPGGKNGYGEGYTEAKSKMADPRLPSVAPSEISREGSSDGYVGRAERPGTRALAGGLKPKDLVGIPWRVAFALQADGWYLRQDIIWSKPNAMPESVRDRCTKAHECLFLLAKSEQYYCNMDAIAEPAERGSGGSTFNTGKTAIHQGGRASDADRKESTTRNKRSVWTVSTKPFSEAHFATFPPDLVEPCILAGSKPGDVVLDPFGGSGTTGQVAEALGRKWLLIELNGDYAKLSADRTRQTGLVLHDLEPSPPDAGQS